MRFSKLVAERTPRRIIQCDTFQMKKMTLYAVAFAGSAISGASALELNRPLRGDWFAQIEGYPKHISIKLLGRATVDNRICTWKEGVVPSFIEIHCDGMKAIVLNQRTRQVDPGSKMQTKNGYTVFLVPPKFEEVEGEINVEFDQYNSEKNSAFLATLRGEVPERAKNRKQTRFVYYSAERLRQLEQYKNEEQEREKQKSMQSWGPK